MHLRTSRTLALGLLALFAPAAVSAAVDPLFGSENTIGSLSRASNVAAGPLDGVAGSDVFADAESTGELVVALQQLGGTWSLADLPAPGAASRATELADLDGDGDLDLVYTDFSQGKLFWRANDLSNSGTFLAPVQVASYAGAQGTMAADIDGDTDLDLVLAGRVADAYEWLENVNGDGSSWSAHTIATSVNAAQAVWAADFDGDGDLDVAGGSSSASGTLTWYENASGDGSTWVGRVIASGRFNGVTAGDMDLDGDLDIVVQDTASGGRLVWFENGGDLTTWTAHVIGMGTGSDKGVQAMDLDFDGDLDVVGARIGFWFENPDDTAAGWPPHRYSTDTDIVDTGVEDIDEDGDLDIVAARLDAGTIAWWSNLTCSPADADADGDGVRDACDVCPGSDDKVDSDHDTVPDGCDVCPAGDDRVDNDGNTVPDACEGGASISISNFTANEGNSGTTAFTFTVTVTGTVPSFTVGYATQDQTASTADADYVAGSGTLTFAGSDGETQTITVQVNGDVKVESFETFLVQLDTPSNPAVTVAEAVGRGTIANDDITALSIDDPSVAEGDGGTSLLVFTVTSTAEVDGGFTIDYYTQDDTASIADGDYVSMTGTVAFTGAAGEQRTISIPVTGDTKVEADERVTCQLRNPSLVAVTVPDGTGHGTLLNDDTAALTTSTVSQAEGDSGTSIFTFTVTLDADVAGGVTVPYATADGTASAAGGDYVSASGSLSFAGTAGETRTLDVTVEGDSLVEADESFTVGLGMPSNPSVTASGGTGTILNDDSATIAIDDVSKPEGNAGTTDFVFTVTLAGDVAGGFTVPFSTTDGTAKTADADYAAATGTLTFAGTAGETRTIAVAVAGDTLVEDDETFTVTLGMPSDGNVTASDDSGLGTIHNDDSATIAIDDVAQVEGDAGTTDFVFTVTLAGDVAGGFTVPLRLGRWHRQDHGCGLCGGFGHADLRRHERRDSGDHGRRRWRHVGRGRRDLHRHPGHALQRERHGERRQRARNDPQRRQRHDRRRRRRAGRGQRRHDRLRLHRHAGRRRG